MPEQRNGARPSCLARLAGGLALFAALLAPALADDESPRFTWGGFGTLGATRTTSNDVQFVRDLSQRSGAGKDWNAGVDSLFGLQGGLRLTSQLDVTVQAVARHGYDNSYAPEITWAFVRYEPTSRVSLRAGRMGTEFFMLSDSRLIGYSYLTVRPPGDFFWYLPFSTVDGVDAVYKQPVGEGMLVGKAFYGLSPERMALADRTWRLDGSPLTGGYLEYQGGVWTVRASYANIEMRHNFPIDDQLVALLGPVAGAQASDHLATRGKRAHYYSLGAIYEDGPWQLQAMLNRIEQGSNAFQSSHGGYLLAGYRVGTVTPYLGYSWVGSHSRSNTLNAVVAAVMADSHSHQNTTFTGLRWDFAHNMAVKAQWDHIDGEAASIFPYRWEKAGWDGKMDVFSLTLDFIF